MRLRVRTTQLDMPSLERLDAECLLRREKPRSSVFRISGSPVYARGERYCSVCRIVHPPNYLDDKCVECRRTLRRGRRGQKKDVRRIDVEPAD